jgi:hypothetical protein
MNNDSNQVLYYKRAPIHWMADDLNGQTKYIKLTSGNLSSMIKGFTVHIWNIEKQEMKVTLKNIKIYQLTGKGVDFKIPVKYYSLIEKITKKPLL